MKNFENCNCLWNSEFIEHNIDIIFIDQHMSCDVAGAISLTEDATI